MPPLCRVVVTGCGVVSPLSGSPTERSSIGGGPELVESLRRGESGIRPFTQIPTGVLAVDHGGEAIGFTGHVDDYGPMDKKMTRTLKKQSKVMCREIQMGVAVAQLAIADAKLEPDDRDRDRTGVVYGCDYIISRPEEYAEGIAACMKDGAFDFEKWGESGLLKINPLWLLKYLPNMPASHIAIFNDLRGPNNSITVRESSGLLAIAEAYSTITRGHADVIITGATGSRIHPLRTLHATLQEDLASDRDDPATMSRPFSADRDGAVVGEGAGAMVLETLEHAKKRNANILGEVFAASSSTVGASRSDNGDAARTAFTNVYRNAIGDAEPDAIGHIHAHGLGTVPSDAAEARAIDDVFGNGVPVTTAKGHIGNLGGGSAMVAAVASLLACGSDLFAVRNLQQIADDCPINAVASDSTPAGDRFITAAITPQNQAAAVQMGRFVE